MNIFITGTDTDAGKTTVSSWICSQVATKYWKLIQTGDDSDSKVVRSASEAEIIPEAYKLRAPLSAYDAANLEKIEIDPRQFHTDLDKIVVEGSGGIFVPITKSFLMIDAIKATNSAVVIVARSKLGMINHVLLTVFALHSRNIPIVGIVVSGDIEENIKNTIEHFSREKIIAVLPEGISRFKDIPVPQEILEILQ